MAKNNIVSWDVITNFVVDAFKGYGIPEEDAKICADVLLESDKRGIESHGVNRFKPIYLDRIKAGIQFPVTNFEIIKETPTTAVVDGHHGMGQVIGYKSMEMAIKKAKEYGMGMVAVRNSTHYGIAGYYADMAANAGCIGMTGTNARPSVAPTFGVEGMFGTNPLTVGIPTDEDFNFLIDCATSIIQNGRVEYYARIGKEIPEGTLIARDGSPVTGDAGEALKKIRGGQAALTTLGGIGEALGGYKGYGYAMIIELPPSCRMAGTARIWTARMRTATSVLIIWAISSLPSIPITSWARTYAARRPATSCAPCVLPRRLPAASASTPRAKKSMKSAWPVRPAYPSMIPCRRKSLRFGMSWA